MKANELNSGYSIYGNKGNVWNNTSHIYKSGEGNLCGTPALANNWARIENITHIGCPECLSKYNNDEGYGDESPAEYKRMLAEVGVAMII